MLRRNSLKKAARMTDNCIYLPFFSADPAVQLRWATSINGAVTGAIEAAGLHLRVLDPDPGAGRISDVSLEAIISADIAVIALPIPSPFAMFASGLRLGGGRPVIHVAEATDFTPLDQLQAEYLFFNPADPDSSRILGEQLRRRAVALCNDARLSPGNEGNRPTQPNPPTNHPASRQTAAGSSTHRRRQLDASAGLIDAFVKEAAFRRVVFSSRTGGLMVHAGRDFEPKSKPSEFEGVQVEYRLD
jgi:hypothetical protein